MNFFEQQMRKIFGKSSVVSENTVFTNRTMITEIGQNLRAKVDFIHTHVCDHYNAMRLTIINRNEGIVDIQVFRFSDIVSGNPEHGVYMWDYQTPDWYIYHPTYQDFQKFRSAVEEYILMYADPDLISHDGMRMSGM